MKYRTLLLTLFLVTAPALPARAVPVTDVSELAREAIAFGKKIGEMATTIKNITDQISNITNLNNLLGDKMNEEMKRRADQTALELSTKQAANKAKNNMTKAENEAVAATKHANGIAWIAQNTMPSVHDGLCRMIKVHAMNDLNPVFSLSVRKFLTKWNNGVCRSQNTDCMGPDNYLNQNRREGSWVSPWEGGDAATPELVDADFTMPRDNPLCMPLVVEATYTNLITGESVTVVGPKPPEKGKICEWRWMAAMAWLGHLAGARPTPLGGDMLASDEGLRQRGLFMHCKAMENTLIDQCARVVGYLTRPNLNDPSTKELIETQKKFCKLMEGTVDLKQFDDCEQGLSEAESNSLAAQACKSIAFVKGQTLDGASSKDSMDSSDLCSSAWRAKAQMEQDIYANCTAAVAAIGDLSDCWAAVEGGRRGFNMAQKQGPEKWTLVSMRDKPLLSPDRLRAPTRVLQPVSAGGAPLGTPVNANNFAWPQTTAP